jgi:iron complex outermembrane receptor protein
MATCLAAGTSPSTDLITESEFLDELPAVATVTRLSQPQSETPAAVTIIDRQLIAASGARDIADLFRLVPGFQVAKANGHRPAVTYHGIGDQDTRRMQILIDGRSVYGSLYGNVSWSSLAIAMDDIDRIEVVRGPNSVSYGANAFLGTINIITRHAVKDRGSSLKLSSGNVDIQDALGRYGTTIAGSDVRVTAGYTADDGLQGVPDTIHTRFANVRVDMQPNTRDTLLFQAGLSQADPQEGLYGRPSFPPITTTVHAHFEQLRWQRQLATNNELSLQFYHNYRNHDYYYLTDPIDLSPYAGLAQLEVNLNNTTSRDDVEFQHILQPWNNWRLVWGAGLRQDYIYAPGLFYQQGSITTRSSRLFSHAEWHVTPATIINAGAMWENTDFTGADISPRLAVNYHLSNDDTVRAIWSMARRIPSMFEERTDSRVYYQGILIEHQNHDVGGLQPETMTTYELGYLGRFPSINSSVDLRLYQDTISNFISEVYVPADDLTNHAALSYVNSGYVRVHGLDMELNYQPSRERRIRLTYARMIATGSEAPSEATTNQLKRLDSVPAYTAGLLAMQQFGQDWNGSVGYYWVGKMLWMSDGEQVPAYHRLDLRLAHRLRLGENRSELALVIQNAEQPYQEFTTSQYFQRRVFVSLSMDFL